MESYASGRLEAYKHELELLSTEKRDALTRKRDLYGRVATSMRVFLTGKRPPSDDERAAFLAAFDQVYPWASEDVGNMLISFLQLCVGSVAEPGQVSNEQFKDAYRECLVAMRRDCGFPDTALRYPVVGFQ